MPARFYRLRVRTADDTGDDIVITSDRSGTNPYLAEAPSGDGARHDPLTGDVDIGAYTVRVLDNGTAPHNVVSDKLYDALGRLELLARRAFVEQSEDGATWDVLVPGYVNDHVLAAANEFEFTIGSARRVEETFRVFERVTTNFANATSLFGGPVRGGFGPLVDRGGYRFRVTQLRADDIVVLMFVDGWAPKMDGGGYGHYPTLTHNYRDAIRIRMISNDVYRVEDSRFEASHGSYASFPDLKAHFFKLPTGDSWGRHNPIGSGADTPSDSVLLANNGALWVVWDTAEHAKPVVGDEFDVYMIPQTISEENPLHVIGHPVDISRWMAEEAGIAYDATSATATKAALGVDTRLELRFTGPMRMAEFERTLFQAFGFAVRNDADGVRVYFTTRLPSASAPSETIALAQLRTVEPPVFTASESSAITRVVVRQQRFTLWQDPAATEGMPNDYIVANERTTGVGNVEAAVTALGDRPLEISIPGRVRASKSAEAAFRRTAGSPMESDAFTLALARQIFATHSRGAPESELECMPSVAAQIGDEVVLDLPHYPNRVGGVNTRGGQRVLRVLKRTETPEGPNLLCRDAGLNAQLALQPTFTIGADPARPLRGAVIAVTNAAALLAADVERVRIEWAHGTTTPTSGMVLDLMDLVAGETTIATPTVDAGTIVAARMQSDATGQRPSAFTAWANVNLPDLDAPTGFSATPAPNGVLDLAWTLGANAADVPVEVTVAKTSEAANPAAHRVIRRLPAGSTRYKLTGLEASTGYTPGVRHLEDAPYAGASARTTTTATTDAASETLPAPENPRAFAGRAASESTPSGPATLSLRFARAPGEPSDGSGVIDGTYGLEATVPAEALSIADLSAVVEVALETAIGAGTYGAFVDASRTAAPTSGQILYVGTARSDGLRRAMRAKLVAPGYGDSAYSPTVTVDPWSLTAPQDYPVSVPSMSYAVVRTGTPRGPVSYVVATYTPPSTLGHMEYDIEARAIGDSAWNAPVRVIGGASGVDRIEAMPGQEIRVTPVTVSKQTQTRLSGAASPVQTVPNNAPAILTWGTPLRAPTYVDFPFTVNAEWNEAHVYTLAQSSALAPGFDLSSPTAEVNARVIRGDGITSVRVALVNPTDYAHITAISFDNLRQRNPTPASASAQGDNAVTPPNPPASAATQATTATTITIRATMPNPLAGTAVIALRLYRSSVLRTELAITPANGSTHDLTEGGLSPGVTYSGYEVRSVAAGGAESTTGAAVSPDPTTASTALDAPTGFTVTPAGGLSAVYQWTRGANDPGDAIFDIYVNAALFLSDIIGTSILEQRAGGTGNTYTVRARKVGWSDSVDSNAVVV